MKNKKGFTLVELLGVLVVLSVILMIAYPLITSYVRNTKEKAYEVQMELMLTSLRDHANEHKEWLPQNDGDYITLTLGQLKSIGIIKDSVINPLDGKEIEDSMEFKISKNGTRYHYEIIENTIETREDKAKSPSIELSDSPLLYLPLDSEYVEPGVKGYDYDGVEIAVTIDNKVDMTADGIYTIKYTAIAGNGITTNAYRTVVVGKPYGIFDVYENGKVIYFNPTTGLKCSSIESVSTPGTKDGCMKWYTFLDDERSSSVKLILDHNTSGNIAWNSNSSGTTPETLNAQLALDIANWNKTIQGKTRIINAEELVRITGVTTWEKTNTASWFNFYSKNQTQYVGAAGTNEFDWLFDHSSNCVKYGCNVSYNGTWGYWTNTLSKTGVAWRVRSDGILGYDNINSPSNSGIRPVIEISKSKLATSETYRKYNDGTPLLYDPVNNVKCSTSIGSTTGTKDGCMKWYAFLDSEKESKVKLILDHNTTAAVAWNTDSTGTTPIAVNAQLATDITNWNAEVKSTARLISASEVNQIAPSSTAYLWKIDDTGSWYYFMTGNQTSYSGAAGSNKYAWLFDNTGYCAAYGCSMNQNDTYGYWTSTLAKESGGRSWDIDSKGILNGNDITRNNIFGVRPVIEVDKSIFE